MGGTAGGITGAQVGRVIDERLLENYRCLDCKHTFGSDAALHAVPADRE